LSEIDALLIESGFPDDMSAFRELTLIQKRLYQWYLRAERFRIENLLAQQSLELMAGDLGPAAAGRRLIPRMDAFGAQSRYGRMERLIEEVENIRE